jgi:N-acetylneuraminate synthase
MNRPYIIAEIGINHCGDINLAKKLINLAKECKCDAVKFQKRSIDKVYTQEFLNSYRDSPWGKTQRAQKLGLEFGKNEYDKIDRYCKEKEIDWFASAWDIDSQIFLEQYNCKYNKIASPMITNIEFLKHVAKLKKSTIISTGMTNLEDIDKAVNIFRSYECPYIIMHCTSIYPCPSDKCNLNMINTLKNRYNCDIGYSGHSSGVIDSYIATVLGVDYIEKHITLDRSMYGSDQSASLEKHGLELTVKNCKLVDKFLGDGKPHLYKEEKDNARKLRYWEK